MSSIDPITTQKEEITALRSIFNKEFKLHRPKNIKKKFEAPCLSITIYVSNSNIGINNSLEIEFDFPPDYPINSPKIILKNSDYISLKLQESLLNLLKDKSVTLIGTPMIHNLVECAREFLHDINKPSIENSDNKDQQFIEYENKLKDLKLQMLQERKDFAKKETICDKSFRKCNLFSHNNSTTLKFEHCIDKVPIEIIRGICSGFHTIKPINDGGKMVINCFEGFHLSKGYGVNIYQISLQDLPKKTIENLKNNWLKKLEEDFYFLYKLSHCNVLSYFAFRYDIKESFINKEKMFELIIQYVTPNPGGMKLTTQCKADIEFKSNIPIKKIQLYLKQVLESLRYLHDKNITKIKINMDTIIIDKDSNLKITYYHIGKRFDEFKITKLKEGDVTSVKKGSKRDDIIKVGKLAKRLFFFGIHEHEMNEENIPGELMAFIDCTRSNITDLHNHPFLYPEKSSENTFIKQRNNSEIEDDLTAWGNFEKSSRIPTEFELIGKLGEGAFGDVVKVKNIYDNQYYAIKRVRLNALRKKASKRTMIEVQLLSSLNHENIVRYYASWSEEIDMSEHMNTDLLSNTMNSSSMLNNLSLGLSIRKNILVNSNLVDIAEISQKVDNHFMNFSSKSKSNHFYEVDSESDSEDESNESLSHVLDNECNENSILKREYFNENSLMQPQLRSSKVLKFLMIQMELCEGPCNTLDKYINEEKIYLNDKLIWKFIREMVSGLEHIHSKNMIHRDLKPTNIFIDYQKKIKIGDLGLATSLVVKNADATSTLLDENNIVSSDKGPVGTLMYICPEMIQLKPYTSTADMYSLGIIIFEMCHAPFSTQSERYSILGHIRLPAIIFPSEKEFKIKERFKDLITKLLNHDPKERPSASELFRSNIIPPPEAREMELRQGLKEIIKDRSSNMYKLLLGGMFNQTPHRLEGYELPLLYQSPFKYFLSNTKPHTLHLLKKKSSFHIDEGDYTYFSIKRIIIRYLESVFICHGAIEFLAPLLSSKTNYKESQAFTLLDYEGNIINLPFNLRDNFANFVLDNNIYNSRRFAIGSTYQQQEYRRDHPKELLEAVFDIVSNYKSVNNAVENLFIINEIFSKLFNSGDVYLIMEVNHTKIFQGIMKYYKIPDHIQQGILSFVYDNSNVDKTYLDSEEFKQNVFLNDSQLINLKSIITFCGRIEDFEKFLKIFFNKSKENSDCKVISESFDELLSIVQMLERFPQSLCYTINVRTTYVPKQSIYKGFVFQLIFSIQDKFVDIFKFTGNNNCKMIIKYLKSKKRICCGGDYSYYLKTSPRQSVTKEEYLTRNISALGLTIDLSTLIQCVYSIEQLTLIASEAEGKYDIVTNSAVSVVVQYDIHFDQSCKTLLIELWKQGLSSVLYDKDDGSLNYVLENKIDFLIQFIKCDDRRSLSDYKIIIKKNDCKGIGLEQISPEDCKTIEKAIEVLLKEYKRKETAMLKLEKEYAKFLQKPSGEPITSEINQENDNKKALSLKPELTAGRYNYIFINIKESRQNRIELKYLVETTKQIQSLRQKNPEIDMSNIQLMVNLNQHLINISKWFQFKLPSQMNIILVELSFNKCTEATSEVSLKALKDPTKLSKIISKIESSVNYSTNLEKYWKDVLSRMWKEIQEAAKDKICKMLIYSHMDDSFAFLDIK